MASHWSLLTPEAAALSVVAAIGAKFLYSYYNGSGAATEQRYVPFSKDFPNNEEVLVVDCTHPTATTLSHHRGTNNPAGLKPSDTSTGLVLHALRSSYGWNKEVAAALAKPYVSTNHFDIDSFLSVWCLLNRSLALQHEAVLRHMARIGDFREAFLSPDLITAHGAEDSITFIREAYTALKLCCWISTLERRLFSAPYEARDCDTKMEWFLQRFVLVLQDPEAVWGDWQQEYTQVVSGFDLLSGGDCLVELFPQVGLATISAPEPLHYYSLFSHTIGCDVVLTMYDGQRYEVECKYHQFVITCGRPVWPRLDLAPLAALLNQMEDREGPRPLTEEEDGQAQQLWTATRFTDTGPLLRLERAGERLTKAQRYGHPCDRPIYSSSIPPSKMQAIVQSFLEFGLQGLRPQVGGFEWRQLHELNEAIAWQDWASCILEQHQQGALDMDRWLTERASRRRASVAASNGGVTPPLTPVSDAAGSPPALQGKGPAVSTTVWSPPPPSAAGGRPEMSQGLSVAGTGMPSVGFQPSLHGTAHILTPAHAQALAGVLPPLYRSSNWTLLYSTHNDGTSLHTLLRKAAHAAPTVLLVRDGSGALFGAYAAEPWRPATRFFGTGETFVFQLEPRRLLWPWLSRPGVRNDFFQYATQECLAVGGGGHWALYLDEELSAGSSGACDTFGSPCLAGSADFGVMAVELWSVHSHVVPG